MQNGQIFSGFLLKLARKMHLCTVPNPFKLIVGIGKNYLVRRRTFKEL